MKSQNDTNLVTMIIIVFLVLIGVAAMLRIVPAIFQDQSLTTLEQFIYGGMFILLALGIIYVFMQKKAREGRETFRREKW